MKKFNLNLIGLLAISFCLISSSGWAATYYVRTADGGTSAECDGTHDDAQSGATDSGDPGSLPDCAFEHYYYAVGWCGDNTNDCTSGPFVGGDTLIFNGEAVSGYDSGFAGCSTGYPYACVSQPIPSGSAGNETKIYGANHASCNDDYSNTTKVWGRERVAHIFDLAGHDYIIFKCLDITDKDGCVFNAYSQAQDGSSSYVCNRSGSYPLGDHADTGIKSLTGSPTNITLDHVKITGLVNGVYAQNKDDWTADFLYLGFNSSVNWDNDVDAGGATTPNHDEGNILLENYTNVYAGCGEVWNSRGTPYYCTSQDQGGYGDGHSTGGGNNANYTFRDCRLEHNVSDDIDNLYDDGTSTTMKVERCQFQGSSGQAIKSAAQTTYVENTRAIGNCGYFYEQPFTTFSSTQSGRSGSNCDEDSICDNNENSLNCPCVVEDETAAEELRGTFVCGTASVISGNGDCPPFNNCRAGSVLSFQNKTGGQKWYNINSTFYSNGDTVMTMGGANTCNGGTLYENRNSYFISGIEFNNGSDLADFFYSDGSGTCADATFSNVTGYNSWVINSKGGSGDVSGSGSVSAFTNSTWSSSVSRFVGTVPLNTSYLTSADVLANFDLVAATNDADETVTCQGDCSVDVNGVSRGASWDIGAKEYASGGSSSGPVVVTPGAGKITIGGGKITQ